LQLAFQLLDALALLPGLLGFATALVMRQAGRLFTIMSPALQLLRVQASLAALGGNLLGVH